MYIYMYTPEKNWLFLHFLGLQIAIQHKPCMDNFFKFLCTFYPVLLTVLSEHIDSVTWHTSICFKGTAKFIHMPNLL